MAFKRYERTYDDYLIEIGDRVEFKNRYGEVLRGKVTGRGAAGNYLQIHGDDGVKYEGYSSDPDLHKIFTDD